MLTLEEISGPLWTVITLAWLYCLRHMFDHIILTIGEKYL